MVQRISYDCCYEIFGIIDLLRLQNLKLVNKFFVKNIEKEAKKRKCNLETMKIKYSKAQLYLEYSCINGFNRYSSLPIIALKDNTNILEMMWQKSEGQSVQKSIPLIKNLFKLDIRCKITFIYCEGLEEDLGEFFVFFLKSIQKFWSGNCVQLEGNNKFNNSNFLTETLKEIIKNVIVNTKIISLYKLPISSFAIYYYAHETNSTNYKKVIIKNCDEFNSLKIFSIANWSLLVRFIC